MKIEVNTQARNSAIDLAVKSCVNQIQQNAQKGITVTECYVDKEIAIKVFRKVENLIENVTRISQRGPTGLQSSIRIGNERMSKFKLR